MSDRMPDEILEKSIKKLDEEIDRIVSDRIKGSHDQYMTAVAVLEKRVLKSSDKTKSCSKSIVKVNDKVLEMTGTISNLKKASYQHGESNKECMEAIRVANERIDDNLRTVILANGTLARTKESVKTLFLNNTDLKSRLTDIHEKQSGLKRWISGLAFLVIVEIAILCYLLIDKY